MSFGEGVASALVGSFGGFLGGLLIYFLKEARSARSRRKATITNLKYELTYNISLYDKFASNVQECIEAIANDVKSVYLTLDYAFVARHFARQFYSEGLLAKHFHPEDMWRWNVTLTQITEGAEAHVVECVDHWREGKTDKESVFQALRHEKKQLKYAKEMSQYILGRL